MNAGKLKTPKSQAPGGNLQKPTFQSARRPESHFELWKLEFLWSLELGAWSFGFESSQFCIVSRSLPSARPTSPSLSPACLFSSNRKTPPPANLPSFPGSWSKNISSPLLRRGGPQSYCPKTEPEVGIRLSLSRNQRITHHASRAVQMQTPSAPTHTPDSRRWSPFGKNELSSWQATLPQWRIESADVFQGPGSDGVYHRR